MIVQFRTIQNPSVSPTDLTHQLVNGLVNDGIITPSQAITIQASVLQQIVKPRVTDTIPPITTAVPSPGPNANGWNNANVTVALNATDNEANGTGVKQINITLSGVQSGSMVAPGGTASVAITAEGVTTVTYFGTDNAGNQETPKTLTVRIDKMPPTAIAIASPSPNGNGWNHSSVTVSFSGTDVLSGIAFCTAPITFVGEGAGQLASGSCTDKAGNVSAPTTISVKIDETAPEAYNQFDPVTKTVQILGRDALSGAPPGPVGGSCVRVTWVGDDEDNDHDGGRDSGDHHDEPANARLCTYTITDLAGNTLVLTEKVTQATRDDDDGHELKVHAISTQYNNGPLVAAPYNQMRFHWSARENGNLKKFDQTMVVGRGKDRHEVDARFDPDENVTIIHVQDNSKDEHDDKNKNDDDRDNAIVKPGLDLLRMLTHLGLLDIAF
jgi:hypothetical protein